MNCVNSSIRRSERAWTILELFKHKKVNLGHFKLPLYSLYLTPSAISHVGLPPIKDSYLYVRVGHGSVQQADVRFDPAFSNIYRIPLEHLQTSSDYIGNRQYLDTLEKHFTTWDREERFNFMDDINLFLSQASRTASNEIRQIVKGLQKSVQNDKKFAGDASTILKHL